MFFEQLKWPEFKRSGIESLVFVLPLGSIEQHGHHLPVSTDTTIIDNLARGLHDRWPEGIVLIPTLWAGHSTHHLHFPGTLSISQEVYQAMLVDLCDSLVTMGARHIFLLNGHGGNDVPAKYALRTVKTRHSEVTDLKVAFASYWSLAGDVLKSVRESGIGGMGHACEMETSLMLKFCGDLVDMNAAKHDGPKYDSPYLQYDMQNALPAYMVEEFHELSASGTVGSPELASLDKGDKFFSGILEKLEQFVRDFQKW